MTYATNAAAYGVTSGTTSTNYPTTTVTWPDTNTPYVYPTVRWPAPWLPQVGTITTSTTPQPKEGTVDNVIDNEEQTLADEMRAARDAARRKAERLEDEAFQLMVVAEGKRANARHLRGEINEQTAVRDNEEDPVLKIKKVKDGEFR